MPRTLYIPLILLPLLSVFFAQSVNANEQFTTNIISTYTVHNDETTTVDQRVTLTNKTSQFFAKEYTLTIASEDVSKVSGRDSRGDIVKDIHQSNGQTRIDLTFNEAVVGTDRQLTFRISYQTKEIANKQGHIWKVLIPALPDSDGLESYTAILKVPQNFSKVAFLKPKPQKSFDAKYVWTGKSLKGLGAVGYFGTSQIYQAKLKYSLYNKNLKPEIRQIALPPDTAYQKVVVQSISPQPENIVADNDGNWLANYKVPPKSEMEIDAKLAIETFMTPQDGFKVDLTEREKKAYLKPRQFWETNNQKIRKIAADLATPKAIYRYVTKNLSYNYKKLKDNQGRIGAAASLENQNNAVCTEFTDLFIALARAAGIPAREVNGYAFTEDETVKPLSLVADVLHAWPEYYDEKLSIWRPVDPTWGNTTGGVDYFTLLDFDHVVFVRHGLSSEYPLPPGYYRQDSADESKQIEISFAKIPPAKTNKPVSLKLEFPREIYSAQKIEGVVRLSNTNNFAKYNVQPKIISRPLKLANKIVAVSVLPPFASKNIKVALTPPDELSWVDNEIQAVYNGIVTRATIKIAPWPLKYAPFMIGGIFAGTVLVLIMVLIGKKT